MPSSMRAKSIGHYILGKTIGEGTFGKVKLGTHILTGEKVAVKILEKERIVDVADVERVAREIHILKLIQHPHVIQLYEIIETPRQLYLIMEYCSGGELFDHIVACGRVREREACRFLHQIMAGVETIHSKSVVHRDLKPENLLLDDHKNIKIVDFGLSNTFSEGQLLKTACGSPCYAAPEMIAGNRYVPSRCDLWSCGVILFALVCGYLPFEDQNTAALYRKILNADYQAPKFISAGVRDLITGLLTTDPERRLTVSGVRSHVWYRQVPEAARRHEGDREVQNLEKDVLEQLDRFGFPRDYAVKCLQMNKHNHVTTTYYLLLEKKRRVADRLITETPDLAAAASLAGIGKSAVQMQEVELPAECRSQGPSPMPNGGEVETPLPQVELSGGGTMQELDIEPHRSAAADADRAGGAPPPPNRVKPVLPPDSPSGQPYDHWAQALGLSSTPRGGPAGTVPLVRGADAAANEGGTSGGATSSTAQPQSARSSVPNARRDSNGLTPRGASAMGVTPRKRSPIQQAAAYATPRGPILAPPLSSTPSRSSGTAVGTRHEVQMPTAGTPTNGTCRTSTPGRRVPPSSTGSTSVGESVSARGSHSSRTSTSQGVTPVPARPSGSATARGQHANEARRRHYAANGTSVTPDPTGGAASARSARGEPDYAAAMSEIGASVPSVGSSNPASAWAAARPPLVASPCPVQGRGSVRASSASPGLAIGGSTSDAVAAANQNAPLSAREVRDEAMRTCRGAFNVSCTSSKAPKQILQEIQRALTLQRVSYKQASAFLVKCQKQSLRFEMEISHLDHLESIYVVRFRRVAGELVPYKELCSKVLAEMKI